jgi:galactokinase
MMQNMETPSRALATEGSGTAPDAVWRVREAFAHRFGGAPQWIVRAPGRINLIGDHTDYNDGFVLPMAIDRAVWIALRARDDDQVTVWSVDFDSPTSFVLGSIGEQVRISKRPDTGWSEYVHGVAWSLRTKGTPMRGWEGVIVSDVPLGAGLSSSAALELAVARAFVQRSHVAWDPVAMAQLAQRAENQWVGVQCGIMDQLVVATGVEGHAIRIDCRTLDTSPVVLPPRAAIIVLDTATRRGLVDSEYNDRRAQCQAAAACFGVAALRDVDAEMFAAHASQLHPVVRRRARHVITENARVLAMSDALEQDDLREAGRLMTESHTSLRDDFEVSSRELDIIVSLAQDQPGCYGARMTGAGFGGSAVAIVEEGTIAPFAQAVSEAYAAQTGYMAVIERCVPSRGVAVWEETRDVPLKSEPSA